MDTKKVSFGFSKLSKKPNVFASKLPRKSDNVELIDCLEGQSIKIKNAKKETKGPLVIPMNEAANQIIDRIKESRAKRSEVKNEVDERPDSELTLDELAARELLREVQNSDASKTAKKVLELPGGKDELVLEGKAEPTLDDYESVPISDYGMAMLRGMGWKEGMVIGKNQNSKIEMKEPALRPKGLGLGANKMANAEKKPKTSEELELTLVKGAFAKITAGHNKGLYCQVEGFDEEAGRVIVKLALKGTILSLNEFLLVPVSKQEYEKSSKVINNAKFEEYKKSETGSGGDGRRDGSDALDDDRRIKKEESGDRKAHRSHRSSSSERDHRKHKKSSKKHRKHGKNDSSDDEQKKRRERSRSRDRNTRKHKSKTKR